MAKPSLNKPITQMSNEDVLKLYLSMYRKDKRKLAQLESRLQSVNYELSQTVKVSEMSNRSETYQRKIELLNEKCREIEERIITEKKRITERMLSISDMIDLLPVDSNEHWFLTLKYIDGLRDFEIEAETMYTRTPIYNHLKRGLSLLLQNRSVIETLDKFRVSNGGFVNG